MHMGWCCGQRICPISEPYVVLSEPRFHIIPLFMAGGRVFGPGPRGET